VTEVHVVKTTRRSNMQVGSRGAYDTGGTLTLTDEALVFEPNWTNFGLGRGFTIQLRDINEMEPVRAFLFGILPSPWSNGIYIRSGQDSYVIRVWGRSEWLGAIEAARCRVPAAPGQ